MELSDYRAQIDQVDGQLIALLAQRMEIASGIAKWKHEHNWPVRDPAREAKKLAAIGAAAEESLTVPTQQFFAFLMHLTRTHERGGTTSEAAESLLAQMAHEAKPSPLRRLLAVLPNEPGELAGLTTLFAIAETNPVETVISAEKDSGQLLCTCTFAPDVNISRTLLPLLAQTGIPHHCIDAEVTR